MREHIARSILDIDTETRTRCAPGREAAADQTLLITVGDRNRRNPPVHGTRHSAVGASIAQREQVLGDTRPGIFTSRGQPRSCPSSRRRRTAGKCGDPNDRSRPSAAVCGGPARSPAPIRYGSSHTLGHILGLPDHYSGPCSELMSGGGPGTACTNAYPNATERATVDSLWATGPPAGPVRETAPLR